jgi:predicted molibdopterin-dependent oxidoreductase YjgC
MNCPYYGTEGSVTASDGLLGAKALCASCGCKCSPAVMAHNDKILKEQAEKEKNRKGFFSFK